MLQLILALTFTSDFLSDKSLPPSPTRVAAQGKELPGSTNQARPESARARLRITEETEVLLNSRPCRYEQVPASAVITFAEVDSDRATLRKIHFRSPN
jgi:hypothetical protein